MVRPKAIPKVELPNNILATAHTIVHGDREQTYGDATINLDTIAEFWSTFIRRATGLDVQLTGTQVSDMMILLKVARLAGNPEHKDSLVDVAGYAALHELCVKAEQQ